MVTLFNALKCKCNKEDYQKALKKLTLFFPSNQVHFNGRNYEKQKGPGTNDQPFFRSQNSSEKFLYWLLSDQV